MKRGFTLLEVLMAVAILGLGLSVLLGAQTGLFASATRTEHISLATGLARCRMSEIELDLLQKGYPLVDTTGEGPCCMGQTSSDGFTCTWKEQRVLLPAMQFGDGGVDGGGISGGLNLGNGLNFGSGLNLGTSGGLGASGGPLALLSQLEASKGAALGDKPNLGSLAGSLTSSMGGVDGLATMAMGIVYPTLKPMLEASIRKVIVSVHWHEGSRERKLDITQYVTNPQQGMLDADGGVFGAAAAAFGSALGAQPGAPGATGTGSDLGTGIPGASMVSPAGTQ